MVSEVFPVIYRSLEQVVHTLTTSQVGKTSEVRQLLKVSAAGVNGILDQNTLLPRVKRVSVIKSKMPFIVMEGLDGSGKTKVSAALSATHDLQTHQTPPEKIKFLKEFFDETSEPIRRAYYSLGNYLAAQEVSTAIFKKGIVMDRYWHSTVSYAAAHQLTQVTKASLNPELSTECIGKPIDSSDFSWPSDLLQPDLVIFLIVSENVRRYRHNLRNTTNTKEEQTLANDSDFRERLIAAYGKISGPSFQQLSADEDIEIVKQKVCDYIATKFPILTERKQSKHSYNKTISAA